MGICDISTSALQHTIKTRGEHSHIFFFNFRLGYTVASNPWKTIFISLFFVFIFGLGILKLNFIKDPIDLWVPSNSKFRNDTKWLLNNLNEGHREESIIISAENVLEPKNLLKLFIINEEIRKIVVKLNDEYEITLDDICFKYIRSMCIVQ